MATPAVAPEVTVVGSFPWAKGAAAGSPSVEATSVRLPEVLTTEEALQEDRGALENGCIDKSLVAMPELKRLRDKDYLNYVASQPCIVCDRKPAQAQHLKFSQQTAMGRKVSDELTMPLCIVHHRDLHRGGNEVVWWEAKKIDPLPTASELWDASHGRA